MIVGRHGGGFVVEQSSSRVVEKMFGQAGDAEHYKNFIECVKSRQRPNADISIAHASNVIAHMGNIAHRIGNLALKYDSATGRFDQEKANAMISWKETGSVEPGFPVAADPRGSGCYMLTRPLTLKHVTGRPHPTTPYSEGQ